MSTAAAVAAAVAAARIAVAQAEAAAAADLTAGEAEAASCAAQASVAYQLAIEILQGGAVELAPALLALEAAAIGEGIAAYLASEARSAVIEKEVFARGAAAAERLESAASAAGAKDEAVFRTGAAYLLAASRLGVVASGDARAAARDAVGRAEAAVDAALAAGR